MKVRRKEKQSFQCLEHGETAFIVKSVAGHDKGKLFCVLGEEENFLYLANGRQRKLDFPKRKKLTHVEFLSDSPEDKIIYPQSNKELRRSLAAFEEVITLGKR